MMHCCNISFFTREKNHPGCMNGGGCKGELYTALCCGGLACERCGVKDTDGKMYHRANMLCQDIHRRGDIQDNNLFQDVKGTG